MTIHGSVEINQCQVCAVVFSRSSSLTNHMKIHTYQAGRAIANPVSASIEVEAETDPIVVIKTEQSPLVKVTLPSISKAFKMEMSLDDEKKRADQRRKRELPNFEGVETESTRKRHGKGSSTPSRMEAVGLNELTKSHQCRYCSKAFAREKALQSHLKMHSNLLDDIVQCENCDACFDNNDALQRHLGHCKAAGAAVEKLEKQEDVPRTGSGKHMCCECSKSFLTKQKLQRHMWIHRKKIYTCEICGVTFQLQENLDSHRLSSHQGCSPYSCNECGKNFSSRQGTYHVMLFM